MDQYTAQYKKSILGSAEKEDDAFVGIESFVDKGEVDVDFKEKKEDVSDDDLGLYGSVLDFFKELPMQFVGGVTDAFNNTVDVARSLGKILYLPEGALQIINPEGEFDLKFVNKDEIVAAGGLQSGWFPRVPSPETTAGGMIRSMTAFVTGFIPAMAAMPGAAGGMMQTMAAGGLADGIAMDPHGQRLSVFLNEIPILRSIIPDYLADSNPENETDWEGRLKNVIEGLGAGFLVESFMKIFRAYKLKHLNERSKPIEAMSSSEPVEQALVEYDQSIASKEQSMDELSSSVSPEELLSNAPQGKVYLNLERIETADDVRVVLQNASDEIAGTLNAGGKTFGSIAEASAEEMKSLSNLLGRDVTRPFTAEESLAAREILNASAMKLTALARDAITLNASKVNLFNFRRALAQHNAIQEVVFAGRKATAQSLAAWRIPAGDDLMRGKMISASLEGKGASIQTMAAAILDTASKGGNVSKVAAEVTSSKWSDSLYQVWINGLLSSPTTHLANVISNTATTFLGIPERYMTAGFEKMFGVNKDAFIEANARASGFMGGLLDGFKLITNQMDDDMFRFGVKIEWESKGISSANWGKLPDSNIGKGIDYLGRMVSLPGWALEKGDIFFKGINYRMRLNEGATRQALEEGLTGEAFKMRVKDLVTNPTEPMTNVAIDFAQYQTFTNPAGPWAKSIQNLVSKTPMGKYVMPFIRTPANILTYGFERTPLALSMSRVREAMMAGGSEAAAATAKIMGGSLLMASIVPLVMNGSITGAGPVDINERRILEATGWQQYSVKAGDVYISYNRLEPIGSLVGYSANMATIFGQLGEDDAAELVAAGTAAFFQSLGRKSFISGAMQFVDLVSDGNPDKVGRYIQRLASSFVPFSGAGKTTSRYFDPVARDYTPNESMSFLRSIVARAKQNIPGIGEGQPPLRDIWGNEIRFNNGIAPMIENISPISINLAVDDPVSNLIADNGIGLRLPSRVIMGVELTNYEYSRYSEVAGKMAKEQLDQAYAMGYFNALTPGADGSLAHVVKRVLYQSRAAARGILIKENPDLKERITEAKEAKNKALLGEEE